MDDLTLYEVLLFAHLTFASIWVGGDAMIQVFAIRAFAAGPQRTAELMKDVEWIGNRVLVPSALLVVVAGVWMVLDSPAWEFSQFWISAGLAVFLASFFAGALFLGPESGRLSKLMDERGVDDPEVQSRIRRVLLVSRIELILLIAVIFDMVVKPGL
jgi:uncharacterized membrane protein